MTRLLALAAVLGLASCETVGPVPQEPPVPPGVRIGGTVEVGVIGTL